MKKPRGLVLSLLLLSLPAFAQIPSTLGWHEVPNTWLHPVCPSDSSYYAYYDRCYNVIEAWNGGIADQARNRMIVWGGRGENIPLRTGGVYTIAYPVFPPALRR